MGSLVNQPYFSGLRMRGKGEGKNTKPRASVECVRVEIIDLKNSLFRCEEFRCLAVVSLPSRQTVGI